MMAIIKSALSIAALVYIGLGLYLYLNQRSYFYYQTPVVPHNFEVENLVNEGVTLKLTVLNKEQKSAIIYFGGNGEVVDYNAPKFSQVFSQYTVFLFKYRGYSGSGGEPSEKANYSDALALYDKIKDKYTDISLMGRSLGSGVATYLASKRKVKRLVLITPFDSLQSIAQSQYPFYPMSILVTDKYDSLGRIKSIKAETLIIKAENDQVITSMHTDRLIKAFPASQLKVETIKNTGHNNISQQVLFYSLLEDFL